MNNIYGKIQRMDELQLRVAAERMAELLAGDVCQLERWAFESQTGGWSTHQVEPMKKRAKRASVIRQGMESVGVGLGI